MTSRERFAAMYAHKDADRIPIIDGPWDATIERWQREGMPKDVSYVDYFGLDKQAGIGCDNSPRFPSRIVEETEDYIIQTTSFGVTKKDWKHSASVPHYIDFVIDSPDAWAKAKERIRPERDRVDWAYLKENYPKWRDEGRWISAGMWFGFDVTHSNIVGTERLLMAMLEEPAWVKDMFDYLLDVQITMMDEVWDAGYTWDCVDWCDDMGYKQHQFFSVPMYRELLKPAHKKAADWGHSKGCVVHLHSCGDVRPFIPEWIGIGINALNPLEVKAGMDPMLIKKEYGDQLVLHGGINALLWEDIPKIEAVMREVIPTLKENGGYIFSSDHSVPSAVSLENFRHIVNLAAQLGSYA